MANLNSYDESRLIGYVARFKREVANVSPEPTGLDDLMDWLEMEEWDIYGEDQEEIAKIARREWMRG